MTKSLTEKWKDGELELNSLWFVRLPCGLYDECFYTGSTIFMKSISGHDEKIWQVLAPVPSYDEWKHLQEQIADAIVILMRFERVTPLVFGGKYLQADLERFYKKWGVK